MGLLEFHLIISISHSQTRTNLQKKRIRKYQNNEDENFVISQNKDKTGKKNTDFHYIYI
jgi:hypothetical protein